MSLLAKCCVLAVLSFFLVAATAEFGPSRSPVEVEGATRVIVVLTPVPANCQCEPKNNNFAVEIASSVCTTPGSEPEPCFVPNVTSIPGRTGVPGECANPGECGAVENKQCTMPGFRVSFSAAACASTTSCLGPDCKGVITNSNGTEGTIECGQSGRGYDPPGASTNDPIDFHNDLSCNSEVTYEAAITPGTANDTPVFQISLTAQCKQCPAKVQ